MKKYLALLLFTLIASVSYGQSNYQDVVHLKNGNIVRGIIIEQVPNKSIKIETADRNVFVFQMDEIEKLTKEPFQGYKGIKGIVELGYEIGKVYYSNDRLKLNIISGYQINPYLFLGFGIGLRYNFDAETALVPIFADFRANFNDNNVSPYLSLGVGYSFNAIKGFKGVGFLLNPIVGVSFMVSDKSAINVGLGYEMLKLKHGDHYYIGTYDSGPVSINVGISL